jgi:hypothetical protein
MHERWRDNALCVVRMLSNCLAQIIGVDLRNFQVLVNISAAIASSDDKAEINKLLVNENFAYFCTDKYMHKEVATYINSTLKPAN